MHNPDNRGLPRSRRVGFRLGAILLGLVPLLLCEGVLRLGGWGDNLPSSAPYLPFDPTRNLFVLNQDQGVYQTAKDRESYFAPQSFVAHKSDSEFRIFVLGGSTVQGRPFSVETAFPTWLQLGLRAADAETQWTVVNCGGISYASYRLIPILREVLSYQPDVIVINTGHNEFLEEQMVRDVNQTPHWLRTGTDWLGHLYTCRLLSAWVRNRSDLPSTADRMPPEVEAVLDDRGGLEVYQRNDPLRRRTVQAFAENVKRMIRTCREAEVPVILMNPVSDLKDTPPFKFANDDALTPSDREEFDQAWQRAQDPEISVADRIEALQRAVSLDSRHAAAHYLLGWSWWEQRRYPSALSSFRRAKDEDLCPLRMLETMHQSVLDVARTHDVPLVDVRALFAQRSTGSIPDHTWLIDHVHPTIRGHQAIADALLHALADAGMVTLTPGWEERREQLVRTQFASLDELYHARGQRQLHYLRLWAQGRADRISPNTLKNDPP